MKLMDDIKKTAKRLFGIGEEQDFVSKVYGLFNDFYSAYTAEWERLDKCERYYRGDHWVDVQQTDEKEPRPVTPVMQSTIENIAADLMDNYPEAIIRPENPQDERIAKVLDALIRQNHDAASYRREYWKLAHDLLTGGYMVQEVGYDPLVNSGIGGAFIRHVDARNVLFDPQCSDIQDGRGVFKIASKTIKWLEEQYPEHKGEFKADGYKLQEDSVLNQDQAKSILLIEYWWRTFDKETNSYRVHMAKVAGHRLLEDSRGEKPDGYYAHGQYPFIVTPLFIRKGSALGFGFVDMFGEQQLYADKMDQIIMKNALMASRNKLLVDEASGYDADDLADWSKDVHKGQQKNSVAWFTTPPLPQYIMQYVQMMRQGIKEESGSNDFSRGSTGGGVTAAAAIASLQEMSSKRSRMAAMQMHEAYKEAVRMEIEVEREFNILPRQVLVTVDGEQQVETFDSAMLQYQSETGATVPIEFMISIKVQRENRWAVMAHNELMLQALQLGALQPDQALELMQFEGQESVIKRSKQPQMNPEQAQAMQQQQLQQEMAAQMSMVPSPDQAIQ